MRGVDRVDRAMADWNVSQKGKNYNHRIFYYGFNAAFANIKIVACKIVEQKTEQMKASMKQARIRAIRAGVQVQEWTDPWAKYFNRKSQGAFEFMMEGRALIERGIRMDWKDINDDSQRPPWIRQVCARLTSCWVAQN